VHVVDAGNRRSLPEIPALPDGLERAVNARSSVVPGTTESGLWSLEPELVELPRAVISTPPFVLVLTDAAHDLAPLDTGTWLPEVAGRRRAVPLLLRVFAALEGTEVESQT
jgi:hypothetical protein